MKTNNNNSHRKPEVFRRNKNAIVLILNILLVAGVFMMYVQYTTIYRDKLMQENLGNVANLNRSSATSATSLINSWNIKLDDLVGYLTSHEMTIDEALLFIDESNSSSERSFELIGSDYTGYLAKRNEDGSYPELSYKSSSYSALHEMFDDADDDSFGNVRFAPEFTDSNTARKAFAVYKHLSLVNREGEHEVYTLMLAARTSTLLDILNEQDGYSGQSTVMIDSSGNYIVSNNDFKSTNFYEYLYRFNDLSLDEKNEIFDEVKKNERGELYYKNAGAVVEDCVYRYELMSSNGWYCVTCVPLSSFQNSAFNINYIIYAIILLLALFAVDMSWLQGMNRRLRSSMLREKEASAAKGNFMSRMSHEIRTPLNAVIGYNTIARDEISGAKTEEDIKRMGMKVMDCLTKSDIASRHLLTIINDVLDMSAIESGKIKVARDRFDFRGLITSLTTIFYSQARSKGVDFEVVFNTLTEEWFVGDQMRTNQILTNLLSNAVKFTPEGGVVKLTIRQPEADTNACHIHFEVSDTGIGMTEEYLSHIWTPFEQADSSISRRFGGTGLGLSITKNLVDLMGGKIAVTSKPGTGTTFDVDLTFEKSEAPDTNDTYDFGDINALVVDDDESTCDYIRLLFNRCGAKCAAVTNGEDAVKAVSIALDRGEPYTICLVDWRMPKMDGIETIEEIRKIVKNDIPIIVLSAYDYTELADRATEIGVNKFIAKPLFQSTLFDLLANMSGNKNIKPIEKNKAVDFGGKRVMLAEDNVMNMEIAKRIMESAGLEVDSVWNGREALERLTSSSEGRYSAILMDVHMPEMDGYQATLAIRTSSHPDARTIPIIAMTADAFAENVAEALAAGMNDHISKPIDVKLLFNVLGKYIK